MNNNKIDINTIAMWTAYAFVWMSCAYAAVNLNNPWVLILPLFISMKSSD